MCQEGGPALPLHLRRHLEPDTIRLQDAERPGPHYRPRQDIETAVLVQGIVGILQVKEDVMGDRLPHGNDLTKQFLLEGGVPRSSPCERATQSVR